MIECAKYGSVPQPSPPAQGTEILWDTFGIPHIFAPDHASLFYAYGYAQMEAHAELLIRLYAQARGRAAEFYGEEYLDEDRWVRTNGIPERAREWAAQQSPEFAPLLQAFAEGLNARAHELIESLTAGARAVLPLTVEDILAHGMRVIHFGWLINADSVETRVDGLIKPPSGSNGWAISPANTASGHAMLLSNSHLPWGDRHTYFEVQLSAPGVTSYGAVWVGFPTLRLCVTEFIGWTQTTNGPNLADLYQLRLNDDGYVLDGETRPFEVEHQVIKVQNDDGMLRDEPLTIRRSAHGPVVVDRDGVTVAVRVAGMERARMFEQFWRMGLSQNIEQFEDAMRMQQLPLFNTMYADRDGHIMYLYNAASPLRPQGDHSFWAGVVPGDDSELITSEAIVPYDELPKVIDPPNGWVQNCNDSPWTCTYPMVLEPQMSPAYIAPLPSLGPRAQRSIRLLSQADEISFDDLKEMKLSTHVELADHFVDDLVGAARQLGGERAQRAADILASWDRKTESRSDGAFLFYRFVEAAGKNFAAIGGYGTAADPSQPLTTPRGFADSKSAVILLEAQALQLEREYGTLHVLWGDVIRLRRETLDLPGNGAPGAMGAIRTAAPGAFADGTAQIESGDTFYFVVEFSNPIRGEALLGYGNWSLVGSKHVTDQLQMASNKQMRPILRQRPEIEAALEKRKVFTPEPGSTNP
jgi:acyl-homoserine-lactone acylase